MVSVWLAPGLDAYARDRLMQVRGPLAPPDDIAIIAIDEASIARFGRFPWSRDLTARAIDIVASAQPKAIALDVLYSEPTTEASDTALADSIARTRNTVVAAQLVEAANEKGERQVQWLRPLSQIERATAGIGHVNISTESDGAARELPLRKADDQGSALWSLAVEAVRVGDGISESEVQDQQGAVRLGSRKLLVANDAHRQSFTPQGANGSVLDLRADPMAIDYIGPSGSFASRTYSFADVLDGKIPLDRFRGKFVLVGATAATLGDQVASPFAHREGSDGNQHGTLMPGVEVLANAVNTILRGRFYRETPDWLATLLAALVAAAVVLILTITQGRFETLKQLGGLAGLVVAILALSYIVFTHWLVIPPIVPALVSLAMAAPLMLLHRSLVTSADLDERIAELSASTKWLTPTAQETVRELDIHLSPAAMIAQLTAADGVAIFARDAGTPGNYRLMAAAGRPTVSSLTAQELQEAPPLGIEFVAQPAITGPGGAEVSNGSLFGDTYQIEETHTKRILTLKLGRAEAPLGALLIDHQATREPQAELLRLSVELATGYLARVVGNEPEVMSERFRLLSSGKRRLPKGVQWKTRALGILHHRIVARARFVDRALRSVEDGLLIADIRGRILFANPRAVEIFNVTERALIGSDLFERTAVDQTVAECESGPMRRGMRDTLVRLFVDRLPVEREITLGGAPQRHYILRLGAVSDDEEESLLGIVASLSDVTKQRELQQTKNDVMMLVTHELRTPLTAIQGMSEVLSQYDMEPQRRREMHLAINEEAKRLARLISDYLDITQLESGARPLRLTAARIAPLVERALLLLDPLAEQREMTIVRRFVPSLPPLLIDADLLAQAVTNLVANAIKYSTPSGEIIVELRADRDAVWIEVADHGHGIPPECLPRIFEKFYRVPRLEDADVAGTGLGLSLVREIAEKHGGRVAVRSEAGVGSVFSLRLPRLPKEETK